LVYEDTRVDRHVDILVELSRKVETIEKGRREKKVNILNPLNPLASFFE